MVICCDSIVLRAGHRAPSHQEGHSDFCLGCGRAQGRGRTTVMGIVDSVKSTFPSSRRDVPTHPFCCHSFCPNLRGPLSLPKPFTPHPGVSLPHSALCLGNMHSLFQSWPCVSSLQGLACSHISNVTPRLLSHPGLQAPGARAVCSPITAVSMPQRRTG